MNTSSYQAELTLLPSGELQRRLDLQLMAPTLYASACQAVYLFSMNAALSECYLDTSVPGYEFICIGRAIIRVSATEAIQIRETLEPFGLRIVREQS